MGKTNKRYSRVSQACEPCRIKKGKCDGRQPICNACKRQGLECSYDPKPRKRGLRPGQFSSLERRAMLSEMIAAFLMSKLHDGEESIRSFFSFQDQNLPFLAPGERQTELDEILDRWKKSPVSKWLLETASRTDPTLDQISRARANQIPCSEASITVEGDEQHDIGRDNYPSPRFASIDVDMEMHQQNQTETAHQLRPLPSNMEDLFEIYFACTHTWLPFVDKFKLTAWTRSLSNLPRYASELTCSQSASLSLTWAVLAYAFPRSHGSNRRNGDTESRDLASDAAKQSLSLIPAFDADMRHENVQALIILAIFFFESGGQSTSWLLIGIAGRVAVDLSSLTPGQHLPSMTRRTSLACFVVEGIIAAALGRKSQLLTLRSQEAGWSKEIAAENAFELEAEGWEEWSSWEMPGCNLSLVGSPTQFRTEPFRVLSTFNQTAVLVEILNTRSYLFNSSIRIDSSSVPTDTSTEGPPELTTWAYHVADSNPSLAPANVEDAKLPHIINFHAVYLLIRSNFHLRNNIMKQDKQRYQETSHALATSVNTLAVKFRSTYPSSPFPLGLTASIGAAKQLLTVEDPLKDLLSNMLSGVQHNGEVVADLAAVPPALGWTQGRTLAPLTVSDLFGGQKQETFRNMRPESAMQIHPERHILPPSDSGRYTSPSQNPSGGHIDLPGRLDLDVVGMDAGETSSISAHDLTVLDAAIWNDKLLTRNLGFMEDSQPALDPELSHLFNQFPQV